MAGIGQRTAPRKRVSIPAVVTAPGTHQTFRVMICDASAEGCQLIGEEVSQFAGDDLAFHRECHKADAGQDRLTARRSRRRQLCLAQSQSGTHPRRALSRTVRG